MKSIAHLSGYNNTVFVRRHFAVRPDETHQGLPALTLASAEQPRVHIADNGVRIVLVDCFELALRLKNKADRDFTTADRRYQLLQIGNLPDVRALINEATAHGRAADHRTHHPLFRTTG